MFCKSIVLSSIQRLLRQRLLNPETRLPRPEIVPCRFLSEANQIGAFASYQKAFLEN